MQKITCSVSNCSHNKTGLCYSNRVDIGGATASTEAGTVCGSFLNKCEYSSLTNNTNSSGPCDALTCNVTSCGHNENKLCNLDSIQVAGDDAHIYTETECSSFDAKPSW
ncbi:DUF1540 domain-containing protein [Inconstantimicrobium mannanitabidum]|uniref:Uncharacterized protein n=1 Tax=Inconstantimicrobium mannanitabidum TaxID=1604901 RepID=A0ACB5R804_9CLOT|nr:DUF1540 domain-containing protein [Clostridium sp. TW13]GKX65230.1 hypothetical protein rsdtw13_04880 [Clostridium sp. TW13]